MCAVFHIITKGGQFVLLLQVSPSAVRQSRQLFLPLRRPQVLSPSACHCGQVAQGPRRPSMALRASVCGGGLHDIMVFNYQTSSGALSFSTCPRTRGCQPPRRHSKVFARVSLAKIKACFERRAGSECHDQTLEMTPHSVYTRVKPLTFSLIFLQIC